MCVAVSAEQLHARAADICHATQGFPGCIPWGVMNVFLMDYLISNRGASKEAAFLVSACFGLGATVGQILAGIIGPSVYKRDKRYLAYFMRCVAPCRPCASRAQIRADHALMRQGFERRPAIDASQTCALTPPRALTHSYVTHARPVFHFLCRRFSARCSLCQLASIAPVLGLLHLPFKLYLMCPLGFIGGLFALMAGPNIKAVVLNVNVPCSRGVAMAIFGTFDDIGEPTCSSSAACEMQAASVSYRIASVLPATGWSLSSTPYLARCRVAAQIHHIRRHICTHTHTHTHIHTHTHTHTHSLTHSQYDMHTATGQGLGPAIIASLVVVVGRQTAFSIAACCWSLSAFIIFLLSFTMVEDEASVEAEVADMLLKSASRSVVRPDTDSGSGKQRADEVGEARDFSM